MLHNPYFLSTTITQEAFDELVERGAHLLYRPGTAQGAAENEIPASSLQISKVSQALSLPRILLRPC